jgi:hypothetical protein
MFTYPKGQGFCVVISQSNASVGVRNDVKRLRQALRIRSIDFQEVHDQTKVTLAATHSRIKRRITVKQYKYLLLIILAKGGRNGREPCFLTSNGEHVNVQRELLCHYTAEETPALKDRPVLTILQFFPTTEDFRNTCPVPYAKSSVLCHVDRALWHHQASEKEASTPRGSHFVQYICSTLDYYGSIDWSHLTLAVNYKCAETDDQSAPTTTTLRAPVLLRNDTHDADDCWRNEAHNVEECWRCARAATD